MSPPWTGLAKLSSVFLRLAVGVSFLSAVADRFGFWSAYGQPNVAWGIYARFVTYGQAQLVFAGTHNPCIGDDRHGGGKSLRNQPRFWLENSHYCFA